MNSPKSRFNDVKVMLSKCLEIDDPIVLKDALYECIASLDNIDLPIKKAVEKLAFLFSRSHLKMVVNTDVTISKELFDFLKDKITSSHEPVEIIFNDDDCIFNGTSIIESLSLTNIVNSNNLKLILVVEDSVFHLKMLFHKLKNVLFKTYNGPTPRFANNYETFEYEDYFIVFCKNGKIAFDVFTSKRPFAVVTDNDMPYMNGHTMANLILSTDSLTKILMISGNSPELISDLLIKYPDRITFLGKEASNSTFSRIFKQMFISSTHDEFMYDDVDFKSHSLDNTPTQSSPFLPDLSPKPHVNTNVGFIPKTTNSFKRNPRSFINRSLKEDTTTDDQFSSIEDSY